MRGNKKLQNICTKRNRKTPHPQQKSSQISWRMLRLSAQNNKHITIQLQKAKNSFRAQIRLFFHPKLSHRAKLKCYMLLIRPIITYAAPIWCNISAFTMENYANSKGLACVLAYIYIEKATMINTL